MVSLVTAAQTWSDDAIAAFQKQELRKIIPDCENYLEIKPITKVELRADSQSIPKTRVKKYLAEGITTGGSTGEPLKVYLDRNGLAIQKATRVWHDQIVTGSRNPKIASFTGTRYQPVLPGDSIAGIRSLDGKKLLLNPYSLSSKTIEKFIKAWNQFKPDLAFVYPSTMFVFANLIQEANMNIHPPKGIITSSEQLGIEHRKQIELVFQSSIHDFYGMSECECIAFQHKPNGPYIVDYHVCMVELLDEKLQPVPPGVQGEIVVTHLHNECQPILRYRTGDYAIGSPDGQLPNGTWKKIDAIHGKRDQENLIAYDGSLITTSSFDIHADYWLNVRQYQCIQIEPGLVRLLLKVEKPLPETELESIEREIRYKFDGRIKFITEQVTRLWKTHRGKTPIVVPQERVEGFDFYTEEK